MFNTIAVLGFAGFTAIAAAHTHADPKTEILSLVPVLFHQEIADDHPAAVRARLALDDAYAALAIEGVVGDAADVWARRAWGWSYFESGFYASPTGSNDHGAACGVMQVHEPGKVIEGVTCEAARKDRVLGYRLGYRVMKKHIETCGSVKVGLGAYATNGSCQYKKTLRLVLARCTILGDAC